MLRLQKNDQVKILTGKESGKQGKVLRVDGKSGKVYIEGRNMVKKAMKKTKQNQQGGIASIEAAIHVSNVMIVCRKCGPTRVRYKVAANEDSKEKVRICRKCGEQL